MVDIKYCLKAKRYSGGPINYVLIFLKDRLVVCLVSSTRGRGVSGPAIRSSPIGIAIGLAVLGYYYYVHKKNKKKEEGFDKIVKKATVRDLLKLNEENFEIPYKKVSNIQLKRSMLGLVSFGYVVINDKKFELTTVTDYENAEKVLKKTFGKKLKVE